MCERTNTGLSLLTLHKHHTLFEHTCGCEPAKEATGGPTSLHTAATPTQIKQWTAFTTRSSVTPGTTVILPVCAVNMQLCERL